MRECVRLFSLTQKFFAGEKKFVYLLGEKTKVIGNGKESIDKNNCKLL